MRVKSHTTLDGRRIPRPILKGKWRPLPIEEAPSKRPSSGYLVGQEKAEHQYPIQASAAASPDSSESVVGGVDVGGWEMGKH